MEVFTNIITSQLEKAADTEKSTLKKQIVNISCLYNSLENDYSTHKTAEALKRHSSEFSDCSSQMKRTFLSTSSVHLLLIFAVESHDSSVDDDLKTTNHYLDLAAFALKTCLNKLTYFHLRNDDDDDDDNDAPSTIIDGDIKILGRPLLQVIWQLKTNTKLESQKKKDHKGKKKLLHLSLICLKELLLICLRKEKSFSELTKEMVIEVEASAELPPDLQHVKNLNHFLDKWIKPLYSELLARSLFLESAVISQPPFFLL